MPTLEGIYDYIGGRIRTEREQVDLSQEDLALRIGLTRTSISNIEHGRQKIQIHTLYEIAKVLNVPPISLLPPPENEAEVEEKYLKRLASSEREWVKNILSVKSDRKKAGQKIDRKIEVVTEPERLLQQAGVKVPPIPVDQIAQQCGAQIRYAPYDGEMSGLLFQAEANIIIGVNSLHTRSRQRFAIAHELGHLALHGSKDLHLDRNFSAVRKHGDDIRIDQAESDANDFAVNLLVPTSMFKANLKRKPIDITNSKQISGLAGHYRVGMEVITYKIMKLGIRS